MWRSSSFLVFILAVLDSLCVADYTLEIRAIAYSNPSNRDYDGNCCDPGFFSCNKCDVDFKFCVRAKGTSATSTSCWYSVKTSDDKSDSSAITFPSSGVLYSGAGLTNPITFSRTGSWSGSFQLQVSITDSDSGTSDDLVDRVIFDVTRSPSNSWTDTINGVKHYNRASFSAQFRIRCNTNYYTSSCSVYCKARDDSGGHYDCSSTGQKVCKSGWSDPSDNCLTPICKSGCSTEGGYCTTPSQCLCNNGWTGSLCNQCIPKTGCSADHGHCEGPYTCVCETGYGGALCTMDADVCTHQSPCTHGGTCTNTGLDSHSCSCVAGYTGTNCETDINECSPDPCQNGATCHDQVNQYTCECVPGYTGTNCELNINECAGDPCLNGGTCNDLVNQYSCSCVTGYVGNNCEGHECDSTPCLNNGTCVMTTDNNGYICDCVTGFEGTHCGSDVNECDTIQCANGGTCINTHGSHYCICATGYTGHNCSIDINDCVTDNCSINSVCIDGVDSYTCLCDNGYTGELCDTLINYCEESTCENGGTCNSFVGSFGCNCLEGFEGTRCEVDIDDCDPNPCENGSTCIDEVNGFTCTCMTGYTGTTCNTAVDYCDPNPCEAGQDCIVDTESSAHSCVICIGDVCDAPAAVIGPGATPLHSPQPTSEPVEEEDQIGPIIGAVIGGLVLLLCCCCCLVCVCCLCFKKRSKRNEEEFSSFEGRHTIVSHNPLFISPEILVNSLSRSLKRSRKGRGSGKQQTTDDGVIENPYNRIANPDGDLCAMKPLKTSGSPRPYSPPRRLSPRPWSPSKQGYISLSDGEYEEEKSITEADIKRAELHKTGQYDTLQVPGDVKIETFSDHSYSSTDNPYVSSPTVNNPLAGLPPTQCLADTPTNDDTPNPLYETLPFVTNDDNGFNPYDTIPSLEDEENPYQEIKPN